MFEPLHAALIERVVQPGLTLLDIGCGAGAFARMAIAAGALVGGVDLRETPSGVRKTIISI